MHKKRPRFVGTHHKNSAVWASYIVKGEAIDVTIGFPELAGEIPHWRQGKDKYWYYHTYYPQELDLNWHNPDVFLEFAKIIVFWSSFGFNFRLDALPFVGKGAYKRTDVDNDFTHRLTAAFRYISEYLNPEWVFIVESFEKIPIISRYLGQPHFKLAHLAYNFHMCAYLWVALAEQDTGFIWQKLNEVRDVPVHADWINFLRNHDELSLAYVPDPLLSKVKSALMKRGEPFREGFGISGRTHSFLGDDDTRFINAYLLASSLPGGLLIPYGDEIGKNNIPLDKLQKKLRSDTRNINRGRLTTKALNSPRAQRISHMLSAIIHKRNLLKEYVNVWPQRLAAPTGVFAASYCYGSSELLVLINITDRYQSVKLNVPVRTDYTEILRFRERELREDEITLGPYAGIWLEKSGVRVPA